MIGLFLLIVFLVLFACFTGAIAIKLLDDSRRKVSELNEKNKSLIASKPKEDYKTFHDKDGKTPLEKVFEEDKG